MKWVIEIIMFLAIMMVSGPFWSLFKAKRHFREIINNKNSLIKLLNFWDKPKFFEEASALKPVFGSWGNNIDSLSHVHFGTILKTQNMCLIGTVIILSLSLFLLPTSFFIFNLAFILLLALAPVNSSLQNQNYGHAQGILMNLYRWGKDSENFKTDQCPKDLDTAWETLQEWSSN